MIRLGAVPFLLLLAGFTAAGANPGAGDGPRLGGLRLDRIRDASVLLGREYAIHFRFGYYRLYRPVEGLPVSDREETAAGRLIFAYGLLGGRADLYTAIDFRGSRFTPADAEGREAPPSTSTGDVGDARLGLRLALPSLDRRLAASVEGFMTLPTGNPDKGFSTESTDGGAILGLSWHGEGFRVHLNTGYRLNQNHEKGALLYPLFYPKTPPGADDTENDAWILRGGVEFTKGRVDLMAEIVADRFPGTDQLSAREAPREVIPGVRVRLRRGWHLSAHGAFNLSRDDPTTMALEAPELLFPDWRFSLALHLTGMLGGEDRDDDGVEDAYDECPGAPEDYDGYRDEDGCPDPDNDRDGVPDDWDKAPNDPEDYDGFEDDDGAPDLDNDGDGLPDVEDFCPDEPEDFDGVRDDDGCPDDAGGDAPQLQENQTEKSPAKSLDTLRGPLLGLLRFNTRAEAGPKLHVFQTLAENRAETDPNRLSRRGARNRMDRIPPNRRKSEKKPQCFAEGAECRAVAGGGLFLLTCPRANDIVCAIFQRVSSSRRRGTHKDLGEKISCS
ncbi:MAG: transporter [Candidatus Eisenbacteria bacterium]